VKNRAMTRMRPILASSEGWNEISPAEPALGAGRGAPQDHDQHQEAQAEDVERISVADEGAVVASQGQEQDPESQNQPVNLLEVERGAVPE